MISPELVIKEALRNRLGNAQDNFARAKRQFQYYTQEQLDQEYGESSSTCRQLLKDYQTNVDNCDNAIKWFEKTLKDVRDSDNVISNLIGERDALQASLDSWVAWAQSSRCIYCGQEFTHDPHDQTGADEAKKVHVLTCAKHPMAQTQAALTEAHRVLRECHEVLANLGYITDDDDPESLCARVAAVLAQEEKK